MKSSRRKRSRSRSPSTKRSSHEHRRRVRPALLEAVVAFVAPGAVVIGSAVHPDSGAGESISQGEWVAAKSNGPKPTDGRHEA